MDCSLLSIAARESATESVLLDRISVGFMLVILIALRRGYNICTLIAEWRKVTGDYEVKGSK